GERGAGQVGLGAVLQPVPARLTLPNALRSSQADANDKGGGAMDALIAELQRSLPAGCVLTGAAAEEKAKVANVRSSALGSPKAVLLPRSTEEVAAILKAANAAGAPIVAWGGKTGLVHGSHATGAIALSLERMNKVESIDRLGQTMVVEAGCI